ncbi:phage tailspike protein, partial [Salmonella enterica subsp. enterica serovar Kentucky]
MKRRTLLKSLLGLTSLLPVKFAASQNLQGKSTMSDITANAVVSMPSQLFTMPRSFKAVANGKIYIGQIDT